MRFALKQTGINLPFAIRTAAVRQPTGGELEQVTVLMHGGQERW